MAGATHVQSTHKDVRSRVGVGDGVCIGVRYMNFGLGVVARTLVKSA